MFRRQFNKDFIFGFTVICNWWGNPFAFLTFCWTIVWQCSDDVSSSQLGDVMWSNQAIQTRLRPSRFCVRVLFCSRIYTFYPMWKGGNLCFYENIMTQLENVLVCPWKNTCVSWNFLLTFALFFKTDLWRYRCKCKWENQNNVILSWLNYLLYIPSVSMVAQLLR